MEHQSNGYVGTHIQGGIATIEFYHPAGNSLPADLLATLTSEILISGKDPVISLIVIRSSGDRAFCAGASFEELMAVNTPQNGMKFFSGFAGVINAIRTCGKLVIARIQGKAVGGGVGIAAAADICFATQHASVRLSELAVGIGPFVIGPAVSRKIGVSSYSYMSLTPDEWQSAQWAMERGLYHAVLDDIPALDNHIQTFTQNLLAYNPQALHQMKNIFWEGTEHWDTLLLERAEISGQLVLSDFTRSAIDQFKKK